MSAHCTKLPVVVCLVCGWRHKHLRLPTEGKTYWCPGCLAMRGFGAAADDSDKAPDVESDGVRLQRVVGLLARWRERADRLQRMALEYEEEDDHTNAVDCSSAAQEIRDCALDLESAMAGKEPNAEVSDRAGDGARS